MEWVIGSCPSREFLQVFYSQATVPPSGMGENVRIEVERNLEMRGGTVVIVEDAATCATTLEMAFLGIPDIAVAVLPTAQEALRLLQRTDCAVRAVVTDLNMPRMDGFEFIERIRAEPRHRRLPIIVVSGDTDPQTPARLAVIGADAFFAKPYSPAQVRLKLEQLLDAISTDVSP